MLILKKHASIEKRPSDRVEIKKINISAMYRKILLKQEF